MKLVLATLVLALVSSHAALSQTSSAVGTWKEPGGSVIDIAPCGADLCLTLAAVSSSAPSRVDQNNPDAALRTRALCGLKIGTGFQIKDPTHAQDGTLYDPKSGKTYRGSMSVEGSTLSLRGYIGIKAFGRSEKWTRTSGVRPCTK